MRRVALTFGYPHKAGPYRAALRSAGLEGRGGLGIPRTASPGSRLLLPHAACAVVLSNCSTMRRIASTVTTACSRFVISET